MESRGKRMVREALKRLKSVSWDNRNSSGKCKQIKFDKLCATGYTLCLLVLIIEYILAFPN